VPALPGDDRRRRDPFRLPATAGRGDRRQRAQVAGSLRLSGGGAEQCPVGVRRAAPTVRGGGRRRGGAKDGEEPGELKAADARRYVAVNLLTTAAAIDSARAREFDSRSSSSSQSTMRRSTLATMRCCSG